MLVLWFDSVCHCGLSYSEMQEWIGIWKKHQKQELLKMG